jgi:hypothetical protein
MLRRWTRLTAGLLLFVVVGATALISLAFWPLVAAMVHVGDPIDAPSRDDIEGFGGVRLPPDVRDLRSRLLLAIHDRLLLARFSIARRELPDLLASGGLRQVPIGANPADFSTWNEPDWWTPEAARSVLRAGVHWGAIWVVEDGPDRYLIYLGRRS